jgi:hypothetical protein
MPAYFVVMGPILLLRGATARGGTCYHYCFFKHALTLPTLACCEDCLVCCLDVLASLTAPLLLRLIPGQVKVAGLLTSGCDSLNESEAGGWV